MEKPVTSSLTVRIITLIAVVANVLFNYLYSVGPLALKNIRDVTYDHPNFFTPAGYAFSIWGVIYLAFFIFSIYALLPSQRSNSALNKLALPLIAANILGSVWIAVFSHEWLLLSVILLFVQVANGIYMLIVARRLAAQRQIHEAVVTPFSIYGGWVSVASIANTAIYLVSIGWHGEPLTEPIVTIILLVVALLLAVITGFRLYDFLYPLVIAWAAIAIYVENAPKQGDVALAALVIGSAAALVSALLFIWKFLLKREASIKL
ncbi:MAG: hypothetical protein U0T73_05845 [Chitinophagales bacterium]